MKKTFWIEFLKRGLIACAGGPVILAIVYGILGITGVVESLSPAEVSIGILTVTVMAFIAAGITAVYQSDRLPLPFAIAVHALVLYLDYLLMYLLNDWIPKNSTAIGMFSGIFAGGFALVWLIIYLCNRNTIGKINKSIRA